MSSWFERFFGSDSRPVRREIRLNASPDGSTVHAGTAESITVSPDGSIDRTIVASFYACGCTTDATVGGLCSEQNCVGVVCHQHFLQCAECLRGLCPRCTIQFVLDGDRAPISLCYRCHDGRARWQRLKKTLVAVRTYLEEL